MSNKRKALLLGISLALSGFVTKLATADELNKKTEFQFSEPVQIPGKVLAAGKYAFQLMNGDSDRNVVEIFSENSNGTETLVATLTAIPDYISQTPDQPIVRFDERPAGTPEAIHSWFYPGEKTGWEFIYPNADTQRRART